MARFVYRKAVELEIAVSPAMGRSLHNRAEAGAEFAKSIAPVGPEAPHYRDQIEAVSEVEGATQEGRVEARDPISIFLEVGTEDTPTFGVLAKTLDHLRRMI